MSNPAALWLLPLVAFLVILARLRPDPLRRVIANVHLWASALTNDHTVRASSRRTLDPLLMLQIAFALAIVAAVSHPLLPWSTRQVTLVIDTSASMAARQGAGTRIDLARARAAEALDGLPASASVRVIAAGAKAADLGTFRAADPGLRRAIAGLSPAPTSVDFAGALTLARSRELIVISDQPPPAAVENARWIQVGEPADNVAITALAARRPSDGSAPQLLAEVFNFGAVARRVNLVFKRGDEELGRRPLSIDPRHAATASIAISRSGGVYTAELAGNFDALALDDRRSTVVRPGGAIRVRVDPNVNAFVLRALQANPDVAVERSGGIQPDIVVCSACATLPPGTAGVLALPGAAATAEPVTSLTTVIAAHPLLDELDFSALRARAVRSASLFRTGATTVLSSGNQSVLAASDDGRRIVALNLKLDVEPGTDGNIVLTPAFPILLANIVDWLAAPSLQRITANVPTESESDLRPPPGAIAPMPATVTGDEMTKIEAFDLFTPLLVLAAAIFMLEWWLTGRRRGSWDGVRWRLAVLALLVAAIARIAIPAGRESAAVVAVIDHSDSIGTAAFREAIARANAVAATMHDDDRFGVVVFGGDAAIERRPSPRAGVTSVQAAVVGSATNIEQALLLSRRMLPEGGVRRLVLISDGRETAGSAIAEAGRAADAGVAVDVVPLDPAPFEQQSAQAHVTSVDAPLDVREHEPFAVSVRVDGGSGARATVRVFRDGRAFDTRDVRLDATGASVVSVPDTRADAGRYVYTASSEGDDDNEPPGAVVTVNGPTRALYLGKPGAVASAVSSAGIAVTRTAVTDAPTAPRGLTPYDLIVLDGATEQLTPAQSDAIAAYVKDGGGLIAIGNRRSLDAATIVGTPLEAALPVDVRPRGGHRSPSTAFVFVFDKSGSMADRENGVQKIELARQAVLRTLAAQRPSDPFGVIAFDRSPVAVAPLESGHETSIVAEKLRAIEPGGATAIAPAIEMAFGWLRSSASMKKHVLLVTDGRTTPADVERLRTAVSAGGAEMSVVAIGPDADQPLLESLARASGGRAYRAVDVRDLPAIAAQDAAAVSGGTEVNEPFTLRVGAHPAMAGVDRATPPRLGGYVVTALKDGSEAMLLSPLDDPILAGWQYGLGRAAAFTSDLRTPWAASMPAWTEFRRVWAQTARWTARARSSGALDLAVTERINGPHLIVSMEGLGRVLDLTAAVRSPSGSVTHVALRATAPGRYEADVPATAAGPYVVTTSARDTENGAGERVERAFYWNANRERAVRGVDTTMLSQIARITRGKVLATSVSPIDSPRPWRLRDVSSWAAAAALVLFVADVARRRRAATALVRWWQSRRVATTAAHA